MPVFLSGKLLADALGTALSIPPVYVSHQQGHLRAALSNNESLLQNDASILGLHISGGTTEILRVEPRAVLVTRLGGSEDLHAGQFIDRLGVRMGLPFPCGAALEALAARGAHCSIKLPASVKGLSCHFSGVETAAQALYGRIDDHELAYAAYDCLARTFSKLIENAVAQEGLYSVLLAGGVATSQLLRRLLRARVSPEIALYFAEPGLCGDNAIGAALMARDAFLAKEQL
jgi:N6-L-threonylcarbamoyladenine synthase